MTTSLRDQVNDLLTNYSDLINDYFSSLMTLAERGSSKERDLPETVAKRIIEVDEQLQLAVEKIEVQQRRQQKIINAQDSIQQCHTALLDLVGKLDEVQQDLDQELEKAKLEIKATSYASNCNVSFTDIISYASKLSKYTSAPPNFELINRDIKVEYEKPYPDEDRMRRGLLYWQSMGQSRPDEHADNFEMHEDAQQQTTMADSSTDKRQEEDVQGDEFWELDLNPDMAS